MHYDTVIQQINFVLVMAKDLQEKGMEYSYQHMTQLLVLSYSMYNHCEGQVCFAVFICFKSSSNICH